MKPKAIWLAFAAAEAVALGVAMLFGMFRFSSVCSRCGAMQNSTEWQIPLTSIALFRHSSERATPVSTALLRAGIVAPHKHVWVFCRGAGNGVKCAIGPGERIWATVQTKMLADVIEAAHQHGESQFGDKLVRLMFDADTSNLVRELAITKAPVEGFPQASDLHSWVVEQSDYLDRMTAAQKKP